MEAAQNGHGGAYRRLLGETSEWLRRYFARRLPPGEVDDAVQETLLAIHRRRHTYDPRYPFGPWLAAIAKNKWVDQLRSVARRPADELTDDVAVGDHEASVISASVLASLLEALRPAQAQAILLVKVQGYSVDVSNAKSPDRLWLETYYYLRFAVAAVWGALAFTVARSAPQLAAVMLVAYPAWDALANYLDASRSGGLAKNKSQMLNFVVSAATAITVAATIPHGMHAVLQIFGVWAVLSGLFQLLTGVRRWKSFGAQWAMILSGAQSGLAGAHMLSQAAGPAPVSITDIAPYAAFGALYFLISAISLTVSAPRRRSKAIAA